MVKKRYAIGTWNYHPAKAEEQLTRHVCESANRLFTYVVGQQELGESEQASDRGNYHLQYVVYNRKGLSFGKLCALFEGSTYTAFDENGPRMKEYVQRRKVGRVEGTQFEAGESPCEAVGKLTELIDEVKNGESDKEKLLDKYGATYARAYKAIAHCIELKRSKPKPQEDPRIQREQTTWVIWLYGGSGTGKTSRAKYLAFRQGLTMYTKLSSTKQWWDDYQDQDAILLDDFRGCDMSFHEFLQFTDPYRSLEYRAQTKGGHITLKAKVIFVTSPKHPIFCWRSPQDVSNDWDQLKRRLYRIAYCEYWKNESDFNIDEGMKDVTSLNPPLS